MKAFRFFQSYTTIADAKRKSGDGDIQDVETPFLPISEKRTESSSSKFPSRTLFAHIIFFFLNSLIVLFAVYRINLSERSKDVACGKRLSQPSPAWESMSYEVQQFEGGLDAKSIWNGKSGPEVDAAWDKITETGFFGISEVEWKKLNPYPEEAVKLPGDRYLATLDVFHKLHCVDLIRRSIDFKYYHDKYAAFQNLTDATITEHLGHCIEILRMNVMCDADLTVMTYNWMEDRPAPMPYFNTFHTCKKWDNVMEWMKKEDVSKINIPMKEDGQKQLPSNRKGVV